jgi:hypothetical protein
MSREVSSRNVLRRIEDTAGQLAKDYSNLKLIPRGTPVFLDQSLRGVVRFAKRRGNFLPTLAADNSSELAADISPPTDTFFLTRVVSGMEVVDAVLTLGPGRELVRISDIDPTTGQVTSEADVLGIHMTGEGVNLFGVPIEMIGNHSAGVLVIQVRSEFKIVGGDQIAIDTTAGLLNSTISTLVTNVKFLGIAIGNRINYELTLERGIDRSLVDEEDILLRGQPGYESASMSTARLNGPFVLDYISGPFFEDTVIDEFLNVQLLNPLGTALPGFEDPVGVPKNYAVVAIPISAESMLFWTVLQGAVQYRAGKFVAVADSNGRFVLSTELVPSFPAGEWQIPLRSNDTALFRVKFEPGDFRDISLSAGLLHRHTVGIPSGGAPASRIEIVIAGRPNVEVEINNWIPIGSSSLSSLVYQITSTAFGDAVWQAGSLMLKPYFFTLADISARYDFSAYDNGKVHF